LDTGNTCNDVFADSAYRSAEIEAKLRVSGYNSRIHRRGRRNHPLSLAQVRVNHAKSRIRARIEHVFGAQQNAPGLQHSPPGNAGTARRGMKTVESSAVFQPKQWAEKDAGKTIENRTQPKLVPNQASKSNIVRGAQ
jgi:IS5 family transposase